MLKTNVSGVYLNPAHGNKSNISRVRHFSQVRIEGAPGTETSALHLRMAPDISRGRSAGVGRLCFFITVLVLSSTVTSRSVGYDQRALVIDGQRRFLISGSIHYPRSTPEMWPGLLNLAKEGGVDVIETYVFWGAHEPEKRKYNFEDRFNLLGFIKAVQDAGLFVNLRIGPYVCAEWSFGGFPRWLKEIPGILFRTDNKPFKAEMERYVKFIVNMMQRNNLFYPQGGPIILTQIENEYRHVSRSYREAGKRYSDWAANMALSLNTSVPWIMCVQAEAPAAIIITCNGFYCDKFTPPNNGTPKMWTENYPGWLHYWGQALMHRAVEDVAFSVAKFFQAGGSYMNYYMYHGGTNFERTSARSITTSYDYHAPIDEYGQVRQPAWGHYKDLHMAIRLCLPALTVVDDEPIHWSPGRNLEIHVYNTSKADLNSPAYEGSSICAAFLSNTDLIHDANIELYGQSYHVPAWSISILPDCKKVVFNTAKVAVQTSINKMVNILQKNGLPSSRKANDIESRKQVYSSVREAEDKTSSRTKQDSTKTGQSMSEEDKSLSKVLQWKWFKDPVGISDSESEIVISSQPLEQFSVTRDSTDYLWYKTMVTLPNDQTPLSPVWLKMRQYQDVLHVFINGTFADQPAITNSTGFYQPVTLHAGTNLLDLLSVTNGLPSSGSWLEHWFGGPRGKVTLEGLPSGHLDLTSTHFNWTHQVGLKGEHLHLEFEDASVNSSDLWTHGPPPVNEALVWYQTTVDVSGDDISPVALDLGSMRKGAAWMNGNHLGRYWPAQINPSLEQCTQECNYRGEARRKLLKMCLYECGKSSQRWYHVPREWLKPRGNHLVLFEEIGGNPHEISISHQVTHSVCSHVSESQPSQNFQFPRMILDCGAGMSIANIRFASFGNPSGRCGSFTQGSCHASTSEAVVKQACNRRRDCWLRIHRNAVGEDPCPDEEDLSLAVEALCEPESRTIPQ